MTIEFYEREGMDTLVEHHTDTGFVVVGRIKEVDGELLFASRNTYSCGADALEAIAEYMRAKS